MKFISGPKSRYPGTVENGGAGVCFFIRLNFQNVYFLTILYNFKFSTIIVVCANTFKHAIT